VRESEQLARRWNDAPGCRYDDLVACEGRAHFSGRTYGSRSRVLRLLAIGRRTRTFPLVLTIVSIRARMSEIFLNQTQCANRTKLRPTPFGTDFTGAQSFPLLLLPGAIMELLLIERIRRHVERFPDRSQGLVDINTKSVSNGYIRFCPRTNEKHIVSTSRERGCHQGAARRAVSLLICIELLGLRPKSCWSHNE